MTKRQIAFVTFSVVATALSLWLFVPWNALFARLMPLPDSVQEQADYSASHGLDGVIVYVQKGGETPEYYAGGWHDAVKRIPADPHALFKIASVTKLYEAAAVAKLAASGSLSLDDTLASFFPDELKGVPNADRITVKQMVGHRSGLRNYTDEPEFSWVEAHPPPLDLIRNKPAEFAPGAGYTYSNTNYYLLGRIIAQASGTSRAAYIRDAVLAPLDLKHTYLSLRDIDPDTLMSGYDVGAGDFDFKLMNDCCVVATAEDVGIFIRALNDGTLFTDAEQAIYTSIYDYGHTGLLPGYATIARYHKDMDTVVILFANTSGGRSWGMVEATYDRVLAILRKRGP